MTQLTEGTLLHDPVDRRIKIIDLWTQYNIMW